MTTAASAPRETGSQSSSLGIAAAVALGSAALCLFLLGVRTLVTVDLGYHLAYGEQTLRTGEPVDHNAFLYTLPPLELDPSRRPDPGPASWYDDEGRYRFPNSNWLSQVAMAAVYAQWGVTGLCALAAGLTLGIGLLVLGTLRRLRVHWMPAALGMLLLGLVCYSRLNLRPELFGYVVLAAQLYLLAPAIFDVRRARELSVRELAAVAGLQILFVNLHSYFLLSLGVVGAILLDAVIRWVRESGVRGDPAAAASLRDASAKLSLLLGAMTLGSFANPWTWRVAVLPIQTLLYLREHDIGGIAGAHPWSHIGEFRGTIHANFPATAADGGILAMFAIAAVACGVALLRRQWAPLFAIAGMAFVSLSMRRNVAPAALVIVPLALAALEPLTSALGGRLTASKPRFAVIAGACGVTVLCAVFAFSIVTNRFYYQEKRPIRFGLGISRVALPVGAAQWLDEHLPDARVWTDMASSSTIHFFTRPHRDLPIISNTWAYPPEVMRKIRRVRATRQTADKLLSEYSADAVILQYGGSSPLFRALLGRPEWRLVQVEGNHAVFARAAGAQADAVRAAESRLGMPDPAAYVAEQRALDPSLEATLVPIGRVFVQAGLDDLAVETYSAIVDERPERVRAWSSLGAALLVRGNQLRRIRDPAHREDFIRAAECFRRVLELEPDNADAARQLERVSQITVDEG